MRSCFLWHFRAAQALSGPIFGAMACFRSCFQSLPGVAPTIGQKMARSLESYVSGLIAGLQPSKSDFRSFSKLLPSPFLFQIKPFRGPKLSKHYFKAQKNKIELKMSKNDFGLDASDWENCALRTAPASLQNFWQIQTGRQCAFCFSWKLLGPSWCPPPRSARKWLVPWNPMSAV